jgi:hypothetical protein
MVTVYYGVICPYCQRFTRLGRYEAESLGQNLRDVTPGNGEKLQCHNPACQKKYLYQRADVAHSLSQDGRDAIHP